MTRPMSRWLKLLIGLLATLLVAWLIYGPLGQGEAYVNLLQQRADFVLRNGGVADIQARMSRSPLSRTVVLCGPTVEFQRNGTLAWPGGASDYPGLDGRMLLMGGISGSVWNPPPSPNGNTPPCRPGGPGTAGGGIPLLIEVLGLSLLAWLIGVGLGWVFRRRPPKKGYLG